MTRILSSTAIAALLLSGAAWAQDSSSDASGDAAQSEAGSGSSASGDAAQSGSGSSAGGGSGGAEMSSDAGGAAASGGMFAQVPSNPDLMLGTDMIGMTVYTTMVSQEAPAEGEGGGEAGSGEASGSGEAQSEGGGEQASGPQRESIGEINDIIVTQDGQIDYVVVGVGGFLGIGERSVAVNYDALEMMPDPENQGETLVTIPASQSQIENAPQFDPSVLEPQAEGGGGTEGGGEGGGSGEDTSAN